jgi:membrane-associated phospholipid phosphatase
VRAQSAAAPTVIVSSSADAAWAARDRITFVAPPSDSSTREATETGFWTPFREIPNDLGRFFSVDTMKVVGIGGAGALAAHRWDEEAVKHSQEHWRASLFRTGNIGGGVLVQAGASVGLYSIARLTGANALAALSGDVIRAQVVSQSFTYVGKFATHRLRPDASNHHSLPSGHAAAAFATAMVLQDHLGSKVGVPAFGWAGYVAASRVSANKHHLSDVLLGAAIGVASGRTVMLGSKGKGFEMILAPTRGGAEISLTKRYHVFVDREVQRHANISTTSLYRKASRSGLQQYLKRFEVHRATRCAVVAHISSEPLPEPSCESPESARKSLN